MKIWMKVTTDEYSLPLAIADSARELAQICGADKNVIQSTAAHHRKGRLKNPSYIYVNVEEGDDE